MHRGVDQGIRSTMERGGPWTDRRDPKKMGPIFCFKERPHKGLHQSIRSSLKCEVHEQIVNIQRKWFGYFASSSTKKRPVLEL